MEYNQNAVELDEIDTVVVLQQFKGMITIIFGFKSPGSISEKKPTFPISSMGTWNRKIMKMPSRNNTCKKNNNNNEDAEYTCKNNDEDVEFSDIQYSQLLSVIPLYNQYLISSYPSFLLVQLVSINIL